MNTQQLAIALVSSSYHPHFGGVEEHVRHVSRELRTRGHRVEVWTVDRGDGLRDEIVEGCRVRYLPTPLPARSAHALGSFAVHSSPAVAAWVRAHAQFRADVINIQCFGPNGVYALALSALTHTPLVVSSHGETLMDEHGAFDQSALLRASLRRALGSSAVTACSDVVADDLRTRFGAKTVSVIPNGVRLRAAEERRQPPPPKRQGTPVLIGAGRLVPQKGFDVLLSAAARSTYDPEVWIVGEGAERSRLEELASTLGISERVRFHGRRTATEVQELMTEADAVVVPSRIEPFGIVVLEAWASGTVVVATSRGGPAGFVSDGVDGLLVDPEDLPSVVEAIDSVIGDPAFATRLALAGLKTVQGFTWSRVAEHYEQTYAQTLSTAPGRRGRTRRHQAPGRLRSLSRRNERG
ncbi:glycosyltransferase family 4 protein [uncultured Ornithinimicrobium sp.]|uniref:glycosyltransferase family 4 protein n=1 Tax=uncultured Ornithinimicrobium sp. TaxID=259307 RepID=UPI0033901B6F